EGDVLFCQGEASDAVYFVIGGRLDVYAAQGSSEPVRINTVEAGEMVGELGAITRQQRTATLKAASQVELLSIATPDFRALLSDSLSLVEAMTLTNREHLMDADKARIQFGASNRQMQKRVARLGEEKEQLQELLQLREELEAMVVHDLRNPLNTVIMALGLVERMKDDVRDPETFTLAMRLAKGAANRMNKLIATLLDIARLEAGKLVLNITEFDLAPLLGEVIEMEQASVTKPVEMVAPTSPGLMVKADREVLWRVVSNLIGNALKFAPASSRIEVTAQRLKDKTLRINVIDAGPGIPEGERERIFEKFTRIKDTEHGSYSGTGLGLTFCRMAVEAHGGSIWIEEGPSGIGSCFSVQLPQD
ncbi:MAG TPA: ATP-binding protein, partial [Smithellaceae bacterium]|nr:ATP-binding protein [Smithellaceae bacterium]